MLTIKNLTKKFAEEKEELMVLKDIDFSVKKGEFLTLIGPSGSGKSTLLRIIGKLEKQTSGELVWEEEPKIGFVFQNFALFPYMTVSENIGFGLKMADVPEEIRQKKVKELIEEIGLKGFENKHPKELSGGMKQRVGIARALAIEPNVLLLDEPFSSLDEFTAEVLRKLLLDLWKARGITVVMVTHLITEALELSDKIVVISSRPGHVIEETENNLPRPRDLRSDQFFKMVDNLKKLILI